MSTCFLLFYSYLTLCFSLYLHHVIFVDDLLKDLHEDFIVFNLWISFPDWYQLKPQPSKSLLLQCFPWYFLFPPPAFPLCFDFSTNGATLVFICISFFPINKVSNYIPPKPTLFHSRLLYLKVVFTASELSLQLTDLKGLLLTSTFQVKYLYTFVKCVL